MPDDFLDAFDLYSLIWEEEVGKRSREIEREEERKAALEYAKYQKSVELLKRQQAQE